LKCALGVPLQNVCFCVEKKTKMVAIAGCNFNIGLYGEIKKMFFFSETRNLIEPKLNMNNHWMVPYTILFLFCVNRISKMAPIARKIKHRTLWGKYFQIICLKPMNHLKANLAGMCLWWSITKCVFLHRSEIHDGCHRRTYSFNLWLYGKMKKHVFSETRNLI
jgi:hypothetical protein